MVSQVHVPGAGPVSGGEDDERDANPAAAVDHVEIERVERGEREKRPADAHQCRAGDDGAGTVTGLEAARVLTPAELAVGKTAAPSRKDNDPLTPGTTNTNPILSPSQLGYNAVAFGQAAYDLGQVGHRWLRAGEKLLRNV